jgi:hypothetical protein
MHVRGSLLMLNLNFESLERANEGFNFANLVVPSQKKPMNQCAELLDGDLLSGTKCDCFKHGLSTGTPHIQCFNPMFNQ